MKQAAVSVIIPIYNVEQYLRRCVDSVIKQTYQNLEIILVDDGSPDHCASICDEYHNKDKRIRVIHKKNGGLASARNAGLNIADGDYIFFLDSDDWLDPESLGELVSIAEQNDVDFVRFRPMYAGWPGHRDGDLCDFGTEAVLREGLYNRQQIKSIIYPRLIATEQLTMGVIVAAWRSLYRRSFLTRNGLLFDETIRYSEDSLFSAVLLTKTNSFYYLDGARYYHYFYNPDSITRSFRADRWDSCKRLIAGFEREFLSFDKYDFHDQLWLQKLYCVMVGINEVKWITDREEKKKYISQITNDPVARSALKHISLVKGNWKIKAKLYQIKYHLLV